MTYFPAPHTRGTAYLLVLASALVVTTLGLGSILAVRVQRRYANLGNDATHARHAAQSALALGRQYIANDPNWRTTYPHGQWLTTSLGDATLTLYGEDPCDTSLSDNEKDLVRLTGIGTQGDIQHKAQVLMEPVIEPLEILASACHVGGNTLIERSSDKVILVGGPLSCNSDIENNGTLDGNVETVSLSKTGTITGELTKNIDTKTMPTDIFTTYRQRATVITPSGDIDKQLLTSTYNPWGTPNSDGVYYVDTEGSDLTIKNSRIEGTLVINAGNKKVNFDKAVFLKSARSDYPVLIISGNVEFKHQSGTKTLSEDDTGINFNPDGSPYEGTWDDDTDDEYPNEIQGLIHIVGTTTEMRISNTARLRGMLLCEGDASFGAINWIIYDPSIYATPPDGYTYVSGMQVVANSYQRIID